MNNLLEVNNVSKYFGDFKAFGNNYDLNNRCCEKLWISSNV